MGAGIAGAAYCRESAFGGRLEPVMVLGERIIWRRGRDSNP